MRYWMWPRRLRWQKKPPRAARVVRKRRPHRTARDRLREFGLNRFGYLWFIPVLVALIIVVAQFRVPKTTTMLVQSAAAQSETGESGIWVRSAKYRTSIPGGYRLAVDVAWRAAGQTPELLVELMLRDGTGSAVASQTSVVAAGALFGQSPLTRSELDIPYDLRGAYRMSVRVSDAEGRTVLEETALGFVTVY